MKTFRLLVWLILSLGLSSCATFKSPFDNTDPLAEFIAKPLRNGKGLVAVLVTPNSGKVNWQQASLRVRKINERGRFIGQSLLLQRVPLRTSSETFAYIGKLFPGRYSVTQLVHTQLVSDFQAVTNIVPVSEEGDAAAMVFTVESGKFSDAGRLLLDTADGDWFAAWASDRKALDDVSRGNPDVANYLAGYPSAAAVKRIASHRKTQGEATRNPNGAVEIQRLNSHGIVAGSRLASVLRRNDKGEWQRSRVGRFQKVLALAEDGEQRLVFAGEDNLLGYQYKKKQAIKFSYIETDGIPPGQFVDMHWSESRGLLVAHQDGKAARLFASKSLKKPNWRLLAKKELNSSVPVGVKAVNLQVIDGYAAAAVFPAALLTSRSPGAEWRTTAALGDVNDFQLRSDGLLQALTINRFTRRVDAQESTTDGAGWRALDLPSRARHLPIAVDNYELVVRDEKLGDDEVAAKLYKRSEPEGKWQALGRMPVGSFYATAGDELFVAAAGFEVTRSDVRARAEDARDFVAFSSDGGKTWDRERER